jgi:hypothetical protein
MWVQCSKTTNGTIQCGYCQQRTLLPMPKQKIGTQSAHVSAPSLVTSNDQIPQLINIHNLSVPNTYNLACTV